METTPYKVRVSCLTWGYNARPKDIKNRCTAVPPATRQSHFLRFLCNHNNSTANPVTSAIRPYIDCLVGIPFLPSR